MAKGKVKVSKQATKKATATEGAAASTESTKKKEPKAKKKGKEWSWGQDDLEAELACIGLRVKQVTGDGNCFFRSLCDQLEGCEKDHLKLRQQVVDYIRDHEQDFQPFVEDDEPFQRYVARMGKDGVWAGYMELIAASNCLQANIHVYQPGQPRWVVGSFNGGRTLHVSYHDGQHYNSVRNAGDHSSGTPPEPIKLQPAATLVNGDGARGKGADENGHGWGEREEQRVSTSSGCHDRSLIRQALQEADGDVDAAVEKVIEVLSARAEQEEEHGQRDGDTEQGSVNGHDGLQDGSGSRSDAVATGIPQSVETSGNARAGSEGAQGDSATQADDYEQGQGQGQGTNDHSTASSNGPLAILPDSAAVAADATTHISDHAADAVLATGSLSPPLASDGGTQLEQHPGAGLDATDVQPDARGLTVLEPVGVAGPQPTTAASDSDSGSDAAPSGMPGNAAKEGGAAHEQPDVQKASKVGKAGKAAAKLTSKKGVRLDKKPSRNKDCPCGSRKKYKNCCGAAAAAASRRQAATSSSTTISAEREVVASATAVAAAAKHLQTWQM